MVKTTINLRDDIYRKLVRETAEKYGNSKNLSRLINEKLEKAAGETLAKVDSDEIKERLRIVKESAGSWKLRKSGRKYVKEVRAGWERRLRMMGL